MEHPARVRSSASGKLTIATIALAGLFFFSLLQFSKKQMRPATYSVSRIVVLPTEVNGPPNATRLAESIPAELAELLRQKNGVDAQASSAAADAPLALTSTATIEENDLTLKVQLIDQHANRILWSHSYPGQLADTGQLVQEAADGVSRLLQSAP